MAAGAVLAISIGITFTLIAQAKAGQMYAAHRARAADVARTKIGELATATACINPDGIEITTAGSFVSSMYIGSYETGYAPGTSTTAIPAGKLCFAKVSVNYPAANGSSEDRTDFLENPANTNLLGNSKGRVTFTRMWARP
jgi:hypothetical protein